MCDCDVKKDCCGCLKGGCDCICDCLCHKDAATDPCSTFPRLNCPDCKAEDRKREARMRAIERRESKVPTDAEIARVFGGRDII